MSLGKDIYDEEYKDYINEDSLDDSEKIEDYSCNGDSKIYVNCKLKVDFDTKNKMIYLYPGKFQYFTVDVLKSCGDVIIKYKDSYSEKGICGNLGIYRIIQSGIIVETYCKLDPKKNDILNFTAIDNCTKECYDFVVVFCFNPCRFHV
ncbi:hypothetical protein [Clostridium saccharoperbutylacetonicum]|uniref:hypothetical protein n=1 Tax=Clostridium saccharoperbutylacetonicum TaxID=36745 RepID=UPI0039EC591D